MMTGSPSGVTITFPGLMSRWTTPASCAACRARAAFSMSWTTRMISARVVGPDGVGEGSVPGRPGEQGSLDVGEMDERRVGRRLPLRLGRGDLGRERLALDEPHRDVGHLAVEGAASYTAQMPG